MEDEANQPIWQKNKLSYIKRYNKKNYVNFSISFRRDADGWIIEKIKSKPNKAAFMKKAIIDAIEKDAAQ